MKVDSFMMLNGVIVHARPEGKMRVVGEIQLNRIKKIVGASHRAIFAFVVVVHEVWRVVSERDLAP